MEAKTKKTSGSVKVGPDTLQEAREFCRDRGLLLSSFVTLAVSRELGRQKKKK